MLSPPARKIVKFSAKLYGEIHLKHIVALLDLFQQSSRLFDQGSRFIKLRGNDVL